MAIGSWEKIQKLRLSSINVSNGKSEPNTIKRWFDNLIL